MHGKYQDNRHLIQINANTELVYKSNAMQNAVSMAEDFSRNDVPLLILGETGVGKDVLAQYIHQRSGRLGAFVRINCGAIPENLLESELFGYEKGAFTGAINSKPGLFEMAHHGTIFLDEIGDMPYHLQVKLLNVLQEKKTRRLGGTETREVELKVISATNLDLEELIDKKMFRQDLYFRLNVLSITIPPLRERREDISLLISYFIEKLECKYKLEKRMDPEVIHHLINYDWPGNIRELKNIVERAYHMGGSDLLLPSLMSKTNKTFLHSLEINKTKDLIELPYGLKHAVDQFEKEIIENMLRQTPTLKECANELGIDISTLIRKKKRLGILDKD